MSGVEDSILYILSFVKSGVIHDNDAVGRKFRKQVLHDPRIENIGIDVRVEQTNREQKFLNQRADDIGAAFGVPVLCAKTTPATRGIAMRAGHIVSKTALIKINNHASLLFIGLDFLLEDEPCVVVRFGVTQRFFYRSR